MPRIHSALPEINLSLSRDEKLIAAAADAWQRGRSEAASGNLRSARLWMMRAMRLAPNDPRITLDLAGVAAADHDAAAAAILFETIATRFAAAAGWHGLLLTRHLLGDVAGATAALSQMLANFWLPADPVFAQVASLVAKAGGAPGWCGLLDANRLRVNNFSRRMVTAQIDGTSLSFSKAAGAFVAPAGRRLTIRIDGVDLCGSPLDLAALRRVEGVVDISPDGLSGWGSLPACGPARPHLTLLDAANQVVNIRCGAALPVDDTAPLQPRYRFHVPARRLRTLTPPFQLRGPNGQHLLGSPIDPAVLNMVPVAAGQTSPARTATPPQRDLAVVMPVYRGLQTTQACLESLFAAWPAPREIIVVDDATPEADLAVWLDRLAQAGKITLLRHAANRGFPAAANTGMRAAGGRDILLLNSDTLVPRGAIETLHAVAYQRAETGSVTPFSNEATIMNYPNPAGGNPAPDLAQTTQLNALAVSINGLDSVEIPTGVGFCMLLRHDCLAATGEFREEIFAQGYGEENDWCLRAHQVGYRHAAATGAFVAHVGATSFRAAGRALNGRNAGHLNRLYPGYHDMIMAALARDDLAPARRRLDVARFAAGRIKAGAVLLISHNHGGGVARRITAEMAAIRQAGLRPILLVPAAPADPANTPFPWDAQLTDGTTADYPNLRFPMPSGQAALLRLLRAEKITRVVLHHGLGHHGLVRNLAAKLGLKQEIVVHDYASFCLRVNLLTRPAPAAGWRYCGEPNLDACVACVARNGDETFGGLGVVENQRRAAAEFAGAGRITTPSADAAKRLARHFPGILPQVTPWENDAAPVALRPPRAGARRIVVIGGIGPAKGFDILIECATDAAQRGLGLEFMVAGASAEDEKLLAAGIFVTGAYEEGAAAPLLKSLAPDLAFLPSIWPETWCFALSEAWAAGLYAVVFDLGAQAARVRATQRGAILPLGLPVGRINDALLTWQPGPRTF